MHDNVKLYPHAAIQQFTILHVHLSLNNYLIAQNFLFCIMYALLRSFICIKHINMSVGKHNFGPPVDLVVVAGATCPTI